MAATTVPGVLVPAIADDDFQLERHGVWKRFRRHRLALLGGGTFILIGLIALLAPVLHLQDPNAIDQVNWQGNALAPGVAGHILGSDENGRDLLSRLVYGAQVSLQVALFAVLMELSIGTVIGAIAGYYGGAVDYWLMRLTDVFLSIPLLPLLLVLTAIVAASDNKKAALSFGVIVVIIGALSWPPVARLVRASFLSLREKEFCEAARAIGGRDGRIIFRHLLPNAVAPIVVQGTLEVASVIILESTLSFLGFGIQPPTASWGSMLANAEAQMSIAPWVAIFPGLCILVTTLSINYLGDGLRDAFDPKLK
jgi:peptide/nickel transport system permease protein